MISPTEPPCCNKCGKELDYMGDSLCEKCQPSRECKICSRLTKQHLSIMAKRVFICTDCQEAIKNN